jgi:hypothetical protein
MNPRPLLTTIVLPAACATALAACGSSNRSATVATTPATEPVPQTTATTAPATTPTTTTPPATSPQGTRTSTAPAFVPAQPTPPKQAAAAVATVNRSGYTVPDASTFKTDQTLTVLIGRRGSGASRVEAAFFFVNGRYIGTDARSPSGSLTVVAQSDTAVTLRYGLYRPGEQSPSSSSSVQFELNNGMLAPSSAIPPVSARR